MNLKKAMCIALVDGWNSEWAMGRVVAHAWRLTDKTPKDSIEEFELASKAVRVAYISAKMPARVWIARTLNGLNNSLWDGRPRETCIAVALLALGVHTGITRIVRVRERDKRHDWNTVK